MMKKYLCIGLIIIQFLEGNAQVNIDVLMDTLNIPATNIPTSIATTGRNVSVITAKDIQQLPVTSVDEVLRYIPGIEVQARNGFGAQADISMRGSTFTQVLILVDGMRLNDPLTAHFNSNIPIALSEIHRIEVLRGPAAAMFGPDAVGGVINIVTKTFVTTSKDQNAQTEANIEADYGQHNLFRINVGALYQNKGLKISGSVLTNQSDGQTIAPQTIISGSDTTNLQGYNNYFDVRTATIAASMPISDDWQLSLRAAYDVRDFSARYFYTTSTFDKSTETTANTWIQAQAKHIGSSSSTDINIAYKYNTDEFIFSPDFGVPNNHITQYYNTQINHLHSISDQFDLKAGVQVDFRNIESNDRGTHEDLHFGVYATGVYRLTEGLQLAASLRGDYDENYDFEISPQLNATYVANDKLRFRGAVGKSIRAADYTERYVSFNLLNLTPGRNLGNPDLKAERSWSEEIGVDFTPIPEWRLSATGFFRQGDNLIDYVSTSAENIVYNQNLRDSASYFLATNIANVQTSGFEIESWYSRQISSDASFSLGMGYTYMNTTNESGVVSAYLSNHAKHLFSANLILKYNKLELGLNGLNKVRAEGAAPAINATLADSYSVWNLRLGMDISKQMTVNFLVHNLFNEQYADVLGAKMPNRWIMGGIRWKL